jgi:hypothetical protein
MVLLLRLAGPEDCRRVVLADEWTDHFGAEVVAMMGAVRMRIEGVDLPGHRDGVRGHDATGGPGGTDALRFGDVHVGVQRRAEVVDLVPADAESAAWNLEVTSREVDGLLDVGGPYVHGRPGARFLYLSWCTVSGSAFTMFRRAKLMFGDIPTEVLRAAHDDADRLLVGRLGLTDAQGGPRCARVRPPDITWRHVGR